MLHHYLYYIFNTILYHQQHLCRSFEKSIILSFSSRFWKCIDRNYIYLKNIASVYKDASTRYILNLGCRFSWLPFLSSCRGHMFTYSVFPIFCAMDADVALLKVTTPWNYWSWYKQKEICIEIVKKCSKIIKKRLIQG